MADARLTATLTAALSACAAAPSASSVEPVEPGAAPTQAPGAGVRIHDRGWSERRSLRQLTVIPLPEAASWTLDDRSSPWFVAEHVPSSSLLRIRTFGAPRLARPDQCEAQARRWDPSLPAPRPEQVLDARPLTAPVGFHGWITASVASSPDGAVEGAIVAFGAAVGRCLAFAYTTRSRGPGADRAVGRRLALIADGVLSGLRAIEVEDRAKSLSH